MPRRGHRRGPGHLSTSPLGAPAPHTLTPMYTHSHRNAHTHSHTHTHTHTHSHTYKPPPNFSGVTVLRPRAGEGGRPCPAAACASGRRPGRDTPQSSGSGSLRHSTTDRLTRWDTPFAGRGRQTHRLPCAEPAPGRRTPGSGKPGAAHGPSTPSTVVWPVPPKDHRVGGSSSANPESKPICSPFRGHC